jgi:hypothetical protein
LPRPHDGAASLGEWFETSKAGRALAMVLMAAILFTLVVWNLPDSHLRREVVREIRPVVWAVGLDQNWAVFAPNPRSISLDFHAEVRLADGTTEVWRPPSAGEQVLSPWRVYRWRKWVEHVRADDSRRLWQPAAEFIAGEVREAGKEPRQVRLVRSWYDIAPPGTSVEDPTWNEYTYYTWNVGTP